MMSIRHNLSRTLTRIFAVICVALALLWPNWRDELLGQSYYYYYYYTVTATAAGLSGSPATFTVTGLLPATLSVVSGNGQTGTAGTVLANPFVVRVTDASGVPVPGVPVTFTVAAGGGTMSAASAVTNIRGEAAAILTLGTTPGTNSVAASAQDAGGAPLTGSPVIFTAAGN